MVRKGRDLIFISQISGDGQRIIEITDQDFVKRNSLIEDGNFQINCLSISNGTYIASGTCTYIVKLKDDVEELFRLAELHMKLMREQNVLISVYTNASGFLWQMMKVDSGTDLGYSEFTGDCKMSGTFTSYNKALKDALELAKLSSLERYKRAAVKNFHWGNYVEYLRTLKKELKKIKNG